MNRQKITCVDDKRSQGDPSMTKHSPSQSSEFATRAASLRRQAANALEPLAVAYRRRAAELELLAAVLSNGPLVPAFGHA